FYSTIDFSPFFFFHDTSSTEIYPLSLHDALPIFAGLGQRCRFGTKITVVAGQFEKRHRLLELLGLAAHFLGGRRQLFTCRGILLDRKSTRLNSSHVAISYAVFCLKKKNNILLK